jgi:hypothetical protein
MRDRERGESVILGKNSAFLQSLVAQAATMIKKEEHEKEREQAAALIQRSFRKHSEERALAATPNDHEKECEQAAALIQRSFRKHSEERALAATSDDAFLLDASTAASVALPGSFDNDDRNSICEDYSSGEDEDEFKRENDGMKEEKEPSDDTFLLDAFTAASFALSGSFDNDINSMREDFSTGEDEEQFEDEHDGASKGEMAVLTEPYYEEGNGVTEEKEEEKEPSNDAFLLDAFTAASFALSGSFHNDEHNSICEDYSSGEDEDQFEDEYDGASKDKMASLTESFYEEGNGMKEEDEEEKEPPPEQAPEKRSRVYLWGVAAAVIAVTAVAVGIGVGVSRSGSDDGEDYCPDVGSYKTYPGRLDVYFRSPLQTLTLDEGEELTDLVVDRYNDLYGCDSDYSRLMLDTTTIRCNASEDECCKLVSTDGGERLLCEFDTLSNCAGCLSSEPLFADPENVQSSGSASPGIGEWRSGVGCFNLFLSRSNADQACVDVSFQNQYSDVETFAPTVAPTTAYPTFSPSTSFPTFSPLSAFVFTDNIMSRHQH